MLNFLIKSFNLVPKKFYSKLAILFILIFFNVFFEILGVGSVFFVISVLSDLSNEIVQKYFFGFANSLNLNEVYFIFVLFVLCFVLKTIFYIIFYFYQYKTTSEIISSISTELFLKYLHADYNFYLKRNSSSLMRNVNDLSNLFTGRIIIPILYILLDSLVLIALIILLLFVDYKSVILLSLIYFTFGIFYVFFAKSKLKYFSEKIITLRKKIIGISQSSFQGIKSLKIFSKEKKFYEFFKEFTSDYYNSGRHQSFLIAIPKQFIELITIFSFTILVLIFLDQDKKFDQVFAYLALYGAAAVRLLPCVNRLMQNINIIKTGLPTLETLSEEVQAIKKMIKPKISNKDIKFENEISFENVSFAYEDNKNILEDISINIKKNSIVGIMGKTASGKSTFLDLILGLLKPSKGQIKVDGSNISDNTNDWYKMIGYVPQNVFILDDTLNNNITLSFGDDYSDDNYQYCKKMSQIEEFSEFKDSKTFLGEHGARLSGGQKQRIGIARALYRKPKILIFDEATNSLDKNTEDQVIDNIQSLKGKITILIVSHSISTLQNCDYIYEIKDKKIIMVK